MPQELVEILMVLALFLVRVGIPILITLGFGYWLEKKLSPAGNGAPLKNAGSTRTFDPAKEQEQAKNQAARAAREAKVIRLHCWDIQRCDPARRAGCAAYEHPDLPCWLALQVTGGKAREACFTCALYKPHSIAA